MASSLTINLLSVELPLDIESLPQGGLLMVLQKAWKASKGPVEALARAAGGKLNAFDPANAASDMSALKGRQGFDFHVVYQREASVGAYWTDRKRSVRVLTETLLPVDVEERRDRLASLNGWSFGGKKIVTDADLKKYDLDFPKKPTVYKNFDEMEKKDKNAVLAFRSWSLRKGGKARLAYSDLLDTQNLAEKDPARLAARKAVNESLKDYYKSF